MPRLIITEAAARGLERCRKFLAGKAPLAAQRAAQAIERQFALLRTAPHMGRPFADEPELRELLIPFGDSGYVALYRFDLSRDCLVILAFRHQKEAGY
ncbi:MAG TPA: type II toxin-antitoxin system RelE/ParE family toxin [Mesorhizobium sp.]